MDITAFILKFLFIWLPIIYGTIYILAVIYSLITGSRVAEHLEGDGCCNHEERDECIVPSMADELECPLMYHAAYDDDKH